ncbi:type II toxin-antitoxin system RelE/ParE family toxin [Sulfurimonas sp.]|uniref:type II toxin-antitoxin system RelE/ParE family toxin n=1 Tax=Sulfurimonas sp. TaxID=2022749 RepID=UPI0025E7059C|nr:type II toxin-antitoxin system RelE/ParE family toxin [Sulfurimonas sp.]MDD5157011.1 type II toxin-antitoxin system RelE/ParE family toxin [Sulfurimonas sp.]
MRIINNPEFSKELKDILKNIANDKPLASKKFAKELKENIKNIPNNPYMYPPSQYFNDKDVRDMTYKKYTIVYQVVLERNTIEIMKIFNKNKPS